MVSLDKKQYLYGILNLPFSSVTHRPVPRAIKSSGLGGWSFMWSLPENIPEEQPHCLICCQGRGFFSWGLFLQRSITEAMERDKGKGDVVNPD